MSRLPLLETPTFAPRLPNRIFLLGGRLFLYDMISHEKDHMVLNFTMKIHCRIGRKLIYFICNNIQENKRQLKLKMCHGGEVTTL